MFFDAPDHDDILRVAAEGGANSEAPHLWRGLVGAWPLQEPGGATAFDVSQAGYPFNGTLMGGIHRNVAVVGRRIYVDGVDSRVVVAGQSRLNFGTGDFALLCWVAPLGGESPTDCIVGKTAFGGNATAEYHIGTIGGKLWGAIRDGSGADGRMDADAVYTLSQWYHACIVRRSGACVFYVDGRPQADTVTITGSVDSANSFVIGNTSAGTSWFTGYVSNVAAYARGLTPAEIAELYADPWAMYRLRPSVFPAAVAEPVLTYRNYILGGGVF